jgi:aryl-alcohol dehydrogenase-like predicted oxidoreductase
VDPDDPLHGLVGRAADLGGPGYVYGDAEVNVGKALKGRRDEVVLATKFFGQMGTGPNRSLGALSDLVHQGKVRYIGSSSYPASQIVEAQVASRDRNLERFVTEQPPYSILTRGIEGDSCRRRSVMGWGP